MSFQRTSGFDEENRPSKVCVQLAPLFRSHLNNRNGSTRATDVIAIEKSSTIVFPFPMELASLSKAKKAP